MGLIHLVVSIVTVIVVVVGGVDVVVWGGCYPFFFNKQATAKDVVSRRRKRE